MSACSYCNDTGYVIPSGRRCRNSRECSEIRRKTLLAEKALELLGTPDGDKGGTMKLSIAIKGFEIDVKDVTEETNDAKK